VGSFRNISGESLAQIRDLRVTYSPEGQQPVGALQGVSLDIRFGEVIGILGESGCGKSTLALALIRLLPRAARYEGGDIRFLGRDLLRLPDSELRQLRGTEIVLIPQDPAMTLNPVMRAGTQISEVLRAHTDLGRAQRTNRTYELLREVGFENPAEIASAYPHQLSGGQRQRIAIAQAIACRPALVIADEATSKLDARLQAEIISLMREIRRRHGIAFLVISHDPSLFSGFADRVVVMYAGRIVEEGTFESVSRKPLHPYTRALLALAENSPPCGARVRFPMIPGELPDLTRVAVGCRFEPRCAERMEHCAVGDPRELMPDPRHYVSCFKYDNWYSEFE